MIALRHLCLLAVALTASMRTTSAAPHPPHADDVTIGERHDTSDDDTRFFTNRGDVVLPLPEETDAFTFAIFGDRTGGPANGVTVLAQAVADVNLLEPDLVMTVGDLIEGYNTTETWMKQMREFRAIMDELLCPWFPVAGNHDIYWRGDGRPPQEHEDHYEMFFGPLWYGFEHKNCGFIVLYSDEGNPETGERAINKAASQVMSPEQLDWLASALERTSELQHVFVFLHHPRWLRGNYGNDWDRVHPMLVDAGNVRAVFAGHIHRARYDGRRDGIEYVTLATVGGVQTGLAPEAGYLHHYNLVTVRPNQIAMSMFPVGEVMDVRAITGQVSDEAGRLARSRPDINGTVHVEATGRASSTIDVAYRNPTTQPIDLTLVPESEDARWTFHPDHRHATIEPGATASFQFNVERTDESMDESIRLPELHRHIDYLAEGARYTIPSSHDPLPLTVDLTQPVTPSQEMALDVSDRKYLPIPDTNINLPDGPMTLECWFKGNDFTGRRGLVAKTENSDYGFFVSNGVPSFHIHLDGQYANPAGNDVTLEPDRWYHIAGVFDGTESRLYLDGKRIATDVRAGKRTRNSFACMIGADVASNGRATSYFDGLIDAVHLSSVARYSGDAFTPERRPVADQHSCFLLNMDASIGLWLFDESPAPHHPAGTVNIVPADEARQTDQPE